MDTILNLYKPIGWTPLQVIKRFKEIHPEYKDIAMTYAGRLDPMADGVLLVLAGEDVFNKDLLQQLDKKYTAEILFGFETDAYDVLGIVTRTAENVPRESLMQELKRFTGSNLLEVPPYSSYKVNGKPMHYWARSGKLDDMQIPKRTMTVHDVDVREMYEISTPEILAAVHDKIKNVTGDFRQEEIKAKWLSSLNQTNGIFPVIKADFHVSSGTYIRSIVHELGERLGCGAILFSLRRSAVGEHTIDHSQWL